MFLYIPFHCELNCDQNQSTLPRTQATGSGHHSISICPNQYRKNASKSHNVPPQPPTRTSSNPNADIIMPSSSSSTLHLDKIDQIHHAPHLGQCQPGGTQIQLVSALQTNCNSSTLKKRVQIQEVTV